MYHKNIRRRPRFYPEFYDDKEIYAEPVVTETEVIEKVPEETQEMPVNYNDLLYPANLRPDSVFKQLENMQKDYIKKKLEVSRANNININPDISGSDKNINRNEAENISEQNNGIKLEIPDDMYIGEKLHNAEQDNIEPEEIMQEEIEQDNDMRMNEQILSEAVIDAELERPEQRINDVMMTMADISSEDTGDDMGDLKIFRDFEPDIAEQTGEAYILTPDSDDHSENDDDESEDEQEEQEAVPTFEHIIEPEIAGQARNDEEGQARNDEEGQARNDGAEPEITRGNNQEGLAPFDRAKAIEYAHRWALDRNPNFLDFDELGGDCTNYISQILLAGGCQMDHTPVYGWYYSSGSEKSPSWTGVEQLYNYLMKDKERGAVAREISAEEAEAGDIVQLSFNGRNYQHTPFITAVTRNPGEAFSYEQIKICAHSFDSQNRALDTYQWRKIRFIRIEGCRP